MKSFSRWIVLVGATIVAGMAGPYGVLAGGTASGTFVFWCVFGLVIVALIAAGTSGWRD